MTKTEYRIVPAPEMHGKDRAARDKYLQYKDDDNIWRYIIDHFTAEVLNKGERDCPTILSGLQDHDMVGTLYGFERELHEFPAKYPSIQDYFMSIRDARETSRIERAKIAADQEIVYL